LLHLPGDTEFPLPAVLHQTLHLPPMLYVQTPWENLWENAKKKIETQSDVIGICYTM
jgi:hypothetical protein